jgi:hypothetical protein
MGQSYYAHLVYCRYVTASGVRVAQSTSTQAEGSGKTVSWAHAQRAGHIIEWVLEGWLLSLRGEAPKCWLSHDKSRATSHVPQMKNVPVMASRP